MVAGKERTYRHPALWVSTTYFALFGVWSLLTAVADHMFRDTFGWTSARVETLIWLWPLVYAFRPLWAPLVEIFRNQEVLCRRVAAGAGGDVGRYHSLPSPEGAAWRRAGVVRLGRGSPRHAGHCGGRRVCDHSDADRIRPSSLNSRSVGTSTAIVIVTALSATLPVGADGGVKWEAMLGGGAAISLLVALYHWAILPPGAPDTASAPPRPIIAGLVAIADVYRNFFRKQSVWFMLTVVLCFQVGLGLLGTTGRTFFTDPISSGGLGLTHRQVGGVGGFGGLGWIVGSVLGGVFVSRIGLKKVMFALCLCANLPALVFVILSQATVTHPGALSSAYMLAKVAQGFGLVSLWLYIMQQIAPGPYRTAHFAFAGGLTAIGSAAASAVGSRLQPLAGHRTFFLIVLATTLVPILVTWFAPFVHEVQREPPVRRVAPVSAPSGIGGWLIVSALQLVGSCLGVLVKVGTSVLAMNSTDNDWLVVLAGDLLVLAIAEGCLLSVATWQFFYKRAGAPDLVILALMMTCLTNVLMVAIRVTATPGESPARVLLSLASGVVAVAVWTAYFLRSKRVAATFVN